MKIEKPLWVNHQSGESGKLATIYSVDVHPDGSRLVTGGGDSNARIWAMEPIVSEEAEKNPDKFTRQLALCAGHTRAVNSVRWSTNGVFLACGSDDSSVSVWMRHDLVQGDASQAKEAGRGPEEWGRVLTCRGHSADVQDVAWSPDDSKLASCSVDNTVMVWAINNFTIGKISLNQPLAKLTEHQGWVKGLAWDPVGKYLATMGDDNVLNVWRATDWKIETQIFEPFRNAKSTGGFVRRISWSPDGKNICGTQAFKKPKHCAVMLERNTWEAGCELVGHQAPVVAARFNNRVLLGDRSSNASSAGAPAKKRRKKSLKKLAVACCAIGDQKGTITVWLTSSSKPIVALRNAMDNGITDLSWSHADGKTLVASSFGGDILVMRFEENELAKPLSLEEHCTLLKELYGSANFNSAAAMLVESTVQLELENGASASGDNSSGGQIVPVNRKIHNSDVAADQPTMSLQEATAYMKNEKGASRMTSQEGIMMQSFKVTNSPVKKKQQESRTKGGKKRIRPVLIVRPLPDTSSNGGSQSGGKDAEGSGSGSALLTTKVPTIHELMSKQAPGSNGGAKSSLPRERDFVHAPKKKKKGGSRSRTQTAPGHDAIANGAGGGAHPNLLLEARFGAGASSASGAMEPPAMPHYGAAYGMSYFHAQAAYPLEKPERRLGHSLVTGSKLLYSDSNDKSTGPGGASSSAPPPTNPGALRRSIRVPTTLEFRVMTVAARDKAAEMNVDIAAVAAASLMNGNATTAASATAPGAAPKEKPAAAKAADKLEEDCLCTTVVSSSEGGKLRWRDDVKGRGSLLAGNGTFSAVAMTSGELMLYTDSGRRRCAGIILPAPLAFLECVSHGDGVSDGSFASMSNSFLLGICVNGEMRIWDACSPRLLVHDRHGVSRLLAMVARELETKLTHKLTQAAKKASSSSSAGANPAGLASGSRGSAQEAYVPPRVRVTPTISRVFLKAGMTRPTPIIVVEATCAEYATTRLVQAFAYNFAMQSWSRVADDRYAHSNFFSLFAQGTSDGVGALASLQAACLNAGTYDLNPVKMFGPGKDSVDAQWTESRAHLEHQLASALLLESGEEYKNWLEAYAQFLADDGRPESVERLREVCSELLGPPFPTAQWAPTLLGKRKHDLLKRVLRAMATNRTLQRVVAEFNDAMRESL